MRVKSSNFWIAEGENDIRTYFVFREVKRDGEIQYEESKAQVLPSGEVIVTGLPRNEEKLAIKKIKKLEDEKTTIK